LLLLLSDKCGNPNGWLETVLLLQPAMSVVRAIAVAAAALRAILPPAAEAGCACIFHLF